MNMMLIYDRNCPYKRIIMAIHGHVNIGYVFDDVLRMDG
jgi:hypothetical protein